jgi:Photosynthesis system II assembly factor YCF48
MQDVPKIVRARLQRPTSATAEAHPDADLLTAFAERSLAGGERDHVLEHLACCADCRDVVAFALPATEDVVLAEPAAPRRGWLTLPVLRWGVVTAGILAIASVGILQYRQRGQEKTAVATRLVLRDQSADSAAPNPAPTPQANASQSFTSPTEMGKQTVTEKRAPAPSGAESAFSAGLSADKSAPAPGPVFPQSQATHHASSAGGLQGTIGGPVRGLGFDSGVSHGSKAAQLAIPRGSAVADESKNTTSAVIAPQSRNFGAIQRAPASSTSVEVSGASPLVATQTTAQNQIQDQLAQNDAAGAPSSADRVGKAKPVSPQVLVMAPAPLLHAEPALTKIPTAPRWTISASGALQRSFDGGNTWLDVDVAANATQNANLARSAQAGMAVEVASAAVEVQNEAPTQIQSETQTAAKSEKKITAKSMATSSARSAAKSAPAARTIFRAVSVTSNAADVWAGGSAGALYHTVDGGNRWARVVPSQAGILLAGDIIAIQFSDARTGIVTTSTAEVWTTVDAGQTWHKQQ